MNTSNRSQHDGGNRATRITERTPLRREKSSAAALYLATVTDNNTTDDEPQHGVQAAEAITVIWSRTGLITAYALYVYHFDAVSDYL